MECQRTVNHDSKAIGRKAAGMRNGESMESDLIMSAMMAGMNAILTSLREHVSDTILVVREDVLPSKAIGRIDQNRSADIYRDPN